MKLKVGDKVLITAEAKTAPRIGEVGTIVRVGDNVNGLWWYDVEFPDRLSIDYGEQEIVPIKRLSKAKLEMLRDLYK